MKKSELRIGNFIEGYLDPQISEWVEMKVCVDVLSLIESKPNNHGFRPIPLTEEWLVKFGFEKTEDYGDQIYYEKERYYFCFDHDDLSFGINNKISYTCLIWGEDHLNYVHQLQNLYFALTGQELTLKTKQ